MNLDDLLASAQAASAELVSAQMLRPLDRKVPGELRLWQDLDLYSMVEGAFGEPGEPRTLTDDDRQRWRDRLGSEYRPPVFERDCCQKFWLLSAREPAGTLGLCSQLGGPSMITVYSLYLLPEYRKAGLLARVLQALQEALLRAGWQGIRLDTYWVWQDSLRYYLRRGFWLLHWKDELALIRHSCLPDYRVEFAGEQAHFWILCDGSWRLLYRAEHHGDALQLFAEPTPQADGQTAFIRIHGEATLALCLALAGWPLVRSGQHWQDSRYSDTGAPEALAHRIQWYEALARKRGWRLATPRIAGLRYPAYAELVGSED